MKRGNQGFGPVACVGYKIQGYEPQTGSGNFQGTLFKIP
jgi:hypothetical protein